MNSVYTPGIPIAALSRLDGVRRSGSGWMARCPAHDDGSPSLSLEPAGDRLITYCFAGCDINAIEAALGGDLPVHFVPPVLPPPRPARWKANAERIVAGFARANDRYRLWASYRDLGQRTVDAYQLGVGILPETSCAHRRLIVPLRSEGVIVGLAGRELGCGCEQRFGTKWINSLGSQLRLFNGDSLKPGALVMVSENRADALLAMEVWPDVTAVALGTAHARREWITQIAESEPRRVVVWLDNDKAGREGGEELATALIGLGVNAEVYAWGEDAELKRDLGQHLLALRAERRSA